MTNDAWTLREAQDWLREHVDDGETCPCCTQFAKVYRRKLTAASVRVLIEMWRKAGTEWVDVPGLAATMHLQRATGGDALKARYWGLIEPLPGAEREDGSTRVGWWRLTRLGVGFIGNRQLIPKYARIYDGRCLNLDTTEMISVTDALGTKFNYTDLMAGI